MKKLILSYLALSVMGVMLTGCADSQPTSTTTTTTEESSSIQPVSTTTEQTTVQHN
jgi:outer membrane lipoprotein SlyB